MNQQNKGPRTKEQHIQFLRGPMTDLIKKHAKTQEELESKLARLEIICQAVNSVKDNSVHCLHN